MVDADDEKLYCVFACADKKMGVVSSDNKIKKKLKSDFINLLFECCIDLLIFCFAKITV